MPAIDVPVPAGNLDLALSVLAKASRLQIAYDGSLTHGKTTRGAPAGLQPDVALGLLLDGTGLEALEAGPGAFVIRAAPHLPAPPAPVRSAVRGEAPAPSIHDIDALHVVGSRLPRQPLESSIPVTIISRHEIESGGYQSLYELLRVEPGVVGQAPVDVALDGGIGRVPAGGAAAASRSALGPRGTLYLVDGRRIATYPFASRSLGGLADLDAIPITLVERVEILRGGASSVYGSDAMAGVVNIVLKADLERELSLRYGLSERGDAGQWRLFARRGFGDERRSLSIALDHHARSGLAGDARGWHTLDRRGDGLADQRVALGWTDYSRPPGQFVSLEICPPGADPDGRCFLDSPRYQSMLPEQRNTAALIRTRMQTDTGIELFANLRAGLEEKAMDAAPFYLIIGGVPVYPDVDWVAGVFHAFFDVGRVSARWRSRNLAFQAGASGALADGRWDLAVSNDHNVLQARVRGAIGVSGLESALDDGSYFVGAPDNGIDAIRRISPVLESSASSYQRSVSVEAYSGLFELKGEPVRGSAGLEVRTEGLETRPDPLMEAGDILLAGLDARTDLRRTTFSAYGELSVPVSGKLLFDASWRLDKVGDLSTRLSPKYGVRYDLAPQLRIVGSLGTGYRAPTLHEQRKPLDLEVLAGLLAVGTLADCAKPSGRFCVLNVVPAENRGLRPETSRSKIAGIVWSPTGDLQLELSHYVITRDNEIRQTVVGDAYAHPELVIRNTEGQATGVRKSFINEGRTEVAGWEWGMAYARGFGQGELGVRLRGTSTSRLSRSIAEYRPEPRDTALASIDWTLHDWQYHVGARHAGSTPAWDSRTPCPAYKQEAGKCRSPALTVLGLGVAYAGWPRWLLRFDVGNALDRMPRNYYEPNGGYDIAYDDPVGRHFLLSLSTK